MGVGSIETSTREAARAAQKVVGRKERQVEPGPQSMPHHQPLSEILLLPRKDISGHCVWPSSLLRDTGPYSETVAFVVLWKPQHLTYGHVNTWLYKPQLKTGPVNAYSCLTKDTMVSLHPGDGYGDLRGALICGGICFHSEEGWARMRRWAIWVLFWSRCNSASAWRTPWCSWYQCVLCS